MADLLAKAEKQVTGNDNSDSSDGADRMYNTAKRPVAIAVQEPEDGRNHKTAPKKKEASEEQNVYGNNNWLSPKNKDLQGSSNLGVSRMSASDAEFSPARTKNNKHELRLTN